MSRHAFEIENVKPEGLNRWLIEGRAYVDIREKDKLTFDHDDINELFVTTITTYGKRTDLLSRMMTGALVVEGPIASIPSDVRFLCIPS